MDITETMSEAGAARYIRADTICHRLGLLEIKSNWTSERAREQFDEMMHDIEITMQNFLDGELDGKWKFVGMEMEDTRR